MDIKPLASERLIKYDEPDVVYKLYLEGKFNKFAYTIEGAKAFLQENKPAIGTFVMDQYGGIHYGQSLDIKDEDETEEGYEEPADVSISSNWRLEKIKLFFKSLFKR